jgi:hypothetical protein
MGWPCSKYRARSWDRVTPYRPCVSTDSMLLLCCKRPVAWCWFGRTLTEQFFFSVGWSARSSEARHSPNRKTEDSSLRYRYPRQEEVPSRRRAVPWRTPDSDSVRDGHTTSSWRPPDASSRKPIAPFVTQEPLRSWAHGSVSIETPVLLGTSHSVTAEMRLRELPGGSLYRFSDQASVLPKNSRSSDSGDTETDEGRHLFGPDRRQTLTAISETLGALNTVGQYLVNITRGAETEGAEPQTENLSGAIYTISKNVLGSNVTDTIAPLVRGALPQSGKVTQPGDPATTRPCTTPDGRQGTCDDLSSCPQLLLDLSNLRHSICFKSLFVPGVCCPRRGSAPWVPVHLVRTGRCPGPHEHYPRHKTWTVFRSF